ncbi:MAG TPA: RcnB family protein [Povalibacter sp.]
MKRLIVAAIAASTLLGSAVMADSRGHDRGHHDHRHDQRYDQRGHGNDHRWDGNDRDYRSYHSHDRYKVVRYYPPRGYHSHAWYRGARMPAAYYAPRYVVHNYGAYRLHTPPRGYHWVRVNDDVVLAAVATGVVLQVVNGIFY